MELPDLDFEQAKARHILFKTRLRSILYGADIDEGPVLSQYECGVGKWIYGHALQAYADIPEIPELEKVHGSIHTCAQELISLYKSGKIEEARAGLSRMELIAANLVALLTVAERKVRAKKNNLPKEDSGDQLSIHYQELLDLHRSLLDLDDRIRHQTAKTEKVARESQDNEQRFRNTVLQAPVGITILRGRDLVVELANETYLQIVGKSERDFVGRPLFDSLPEVRSVVEPLLMGVLDTGVPFHANELEVTLNRFGKTEQTWFNLAYQALRDIGNDITGIIVVATEVTQQVQSRHIIQQREIQFRNLVTQSPIGMTIFKGRDFVIDIANEPVLKKLWRRTLEEVQGRKLLDVFPELRDQKFPKLLNDVFDTGIPYKETEALAFIAAIDGTNKYFLDFEYAPITDTNGEIFAIMVTVNDVTEKVNTRQQIADAAERLKLATEGTQMGTWDLNLLTRDILHSPRFAVIFGYEENAALTHLKMRETLHPEDRIKIVEPAFERALKTGIYFYESRVIHKDKSVRWIRTRGTVMYGDDKTPLRMVGTMLDITDQKLAQQRLEESEERLQIVIDASDLGIWELNIKTDDVKLSSRYLEIFGFSTNDEVSHDKFIDQIHPDFISMRNRAFQEALFTGVLYYESAIVWRDKSEHWIEAKGRVMYDDAGAPEKLIGTLRDITDERLYNQRIEESERRFRTVADTAPALIWMAGPDQQCTFFNKAWLDFTGRSPADEIGSGWAQGIHPDDASKYLELYSANFEKRAEFYMEYRLRRFDGTYRWISNNAVPRFTSEGIFEGYIGAGMDINDRIIFEEQLKESESRLRIAALSSELGTWTFDPKTQAITWDAQSRELYGVGPDTPVNLDLFWERMHPDDREPTLLKMRNALDNTRKETFDAEYRIIIPGNHEVKWIHAKGKAFFGDDNLPYLFSGTILDATEKKKAIDELQENELKFRTLADSMPQFIWTGDEKGVLDYFNQSVYDYSGLTPDQIATEGWLQIVHPDDQELNVEKWVASVASGEDFVYEHRFRRHDGVYRWQLSRAIALRGPDGRIQTWVGTSTDIHDRRIFIDQLETSVQQRTQELKVANEDLLRSNNELEQFVYVASHDLQEPLRKIQTFVTRVIETENDNLSPKGKDYLTRMQNSSRRMQQLILDLLAFSRANTAEQHFLLTDINLLLEKVKDHLSELIDTNKVTIRSSILPDLNVITFQFEQLFSNLIGNAIKFAQSGLPCVIEITSGTAPGKDIGHPAAEPLRSYVFIKIKDNGIGFDQQFSERIFQVFQRLHGRDTYEGTGIGLAICKKIAENHHGFIVATGKAGGGASFTIYLPAPAAR